MKYVVIGLGAIGSIIGGLLSKSGLNVELIGKKNQIEKIVKKGIKIYGIKESILVEKINASDDFSQVQDADVIFVCVKAQDTQNVADELKKYIKKSAIIISLQNGIRNSRILENTTGNRSYSGVILFNALYSQRGEVTLTLKGGLIIEVDNYSENIIKSFIESLKKFDIKIKLENVIEGYLWSKLIVNLQNAVTTLTNQTVKESILNNDTRAIIIATMKEGLSVLDKSGITYETLPDIDPKKTISRLEVLNSALLRRGSQILKLNENARNSMWQSISRGRPTEIDYLNGEIVNLAIENNLNAPINTKLVELIKKAEKDSFKNKYSPKELRKLLKF